MCVYEMRSFFVSVQFFIDFPSYCNISFIVIYDRHTGCCGESDGET